MLRNDNCHYTENHFLSVIMLSVNMLSIVMLSNDDCHYYESHFLFCMLF